METTPPTNNRRLRLKIIGASVAVLALIVAAVVIWQLTHRPKKITDFAGCVDAGYPVADSFPETCTVPKVGTFINPDQHVDTSVGPTKTNITFTALVTSQLAGPSEAKQVVITNQADWQKYWHQAHLFMPVEPPILAVDFTKDNVAAVQAGPKVSTGYSYLITSISDDGSGLEIAVRLTTPGKGCKPKEPPTAPYHIVKFTKVDKPADFKIETKAVDCQ